MSGMPRAQRFAEIRALQRAHPDWTQQQVGATLGITQSAVANVLHDPDGAKQRARRESYVGTCEDCGGETRSDGTSNPSPLCAPCASARTKYWTADSVVDAIQRFAAVHGRPPYSTEWIKVDPDNGYPSRGNVYRSSSSHSGAPFASWADAIEAAGFARPLVGKRAGQRWWSHAEILAELRRIAVAGVAPSSDKHPLCSIVLRYFPTWTEACHEAGLRTQRDVYGYRPPRHLKVAA